MDNIKYYDFLVKFMREKNSKKFWDELNSIIKSHSIYYKKLNIIQKINLAYQTRISSISDKEYNSFYELRRNIMLFPLNANISVDDLELLIMIIKRCVLIYDYAFNENLTLLKPEEYDKDFDDDFGRGVNFRCPEVKNKDDDTSGFGSGTSGYGSGTSGYGSGTNSLTSLTGGNDVNTKENYNNIEIKFDYIDITSQLCNISINTNAKIIQDKINKGYPKFDINKYYKLNPSFVYLGDNIILMSYRLFMGKFDNCDKYDLDNCHPWKDFWHTDVYNREKLGNVLIKINYVGLCLINITNWTVIQDTILKINDKPFGFEDVRLFIFNDKVYMVGAVTVGISEPAISSWNDPRILKQLICEIGNIVDLKNNLPNKRLDVMYNCYDENKSNIEKNWFGYVSSNNNVLINPKYPGFYPLKQYKIDLSETQKIKSENYLCDYYKEINSDKCETNVLGDITEIDFIGKLNQYYKTTLNLLKDDSKYVFRLSGGSWGVKLDENTILFLGHIVAYLSNFDTTKVNEYLTTHSDDDLVSKNLNSLFNNKLKHELGYGSHVMRYYMVFYKININENKVTGMSHSFNIFGNQDINTMVNFPLGLAILDNDVIMSFGESDNKTILVKMDKKYINELFKDTEPEKYFFITWINQANTQYKSKYLKYKQKYLSVINK